MRTLLKTNDIVLLDFAKALLRDAEIEAVVFDESMSVMDGSLGILPRRLMTNAVQSVFTALKAPVLIITKSTPEGAIQGLISCLQQEGH